MNLTKIYQGLKEYRDVRHISVKSQKEKYLVNVMDKFGELAWCLNALNSKNDGARKAAELGIVGVLCDIAFFTINAASDIPDIEKTSSINLSDDGFETVNDLFVLPFACAKFACYPNSYQVFNDIMEFCADICKHYGFDFEVAMNETVKEVNSQTGVYDESSKKWILDESYEAKDNWHRADYEKARIKQG